MTLTKKQRAFAEEYVKDFNATQAALRAGYSQKTAYSIGWENLRKPEIAAYIDKRMKDLTMQANEVLLRLSDQARGSVEDFIDISKSGAWSLNLEKARKRGKLHLLKRVGYDARGNPKLELYSSQDALDKLAQHHGLFKKVLEVHWQEQLQDAGVDISKEYEELVNKLAAELEASDE